MTPNQNAKDVFKTLADVGMLADKDLQDHKISLAEAFGFIPSLMSFPGILPKFKPALEELETADQESQADLIKYIEDNFDLRDDNTEAAIEDLTAMLTHGSRLFGRFVQKKTK